jgi:hypothetical protein
MDAPELRSARYMPDIPSLPAHPTLRPCFNISFVFQLTIEALYHAMLLCLYTDGVAAQKNKHLL